MEVLGFVLVGLVIIAAVVFFGFRRVVQYIVVAREQRRSTDAEVEQWERKLAVLESKAVVEFFAPSSDFVKEWDPEKKKILPAAWASPYRRAVLKLWDKRKSESPNKLALVRQQVAAAADQIFIETLPEDEQPANGGPDHFSIEIPMNGRPSSDIEALSPTFKSLLKLDRRDWSLTQIDPREPGMVRFVGHASEPADRLVAQKNGAEWFDENPASSPYLLPLAVDDKGSPVCLRVHHTFIYGTTGAGKGSVLSGMMHQLAPFIEQGLVGIYAIDPNGAELEKFQESSLLKAYASSQEDAEALITYVYNLMNARTAALIRNEENEYGDKHVISKENPLTLLIIDEMSSVLDTMQTGRKAAQALNDLTLIYSQGRKRGFFVIGAAQNARAETLPAAIRANIQNWILLRIGAVDSYFNALLLGDEAVLRGFDATKITAAPAAHGMSEEDADKLTAGIGFLRRAANMPVKIRFAHMSGAALRRLADAHKLPIGETVPKLPTMTGKLQAAFETLSDELVARSVPGREAAAVEESSAVSTDNRKAFFEPEGIAPSDDATPRRSQVDELAEVREWPQEKLLRARERFTARLQQQSSIKGRALLDAIEAQIRLNDHMATFARPTDDDDNETALPNIY